MTRKELAGRWFDVQIQRGMKLHNRARFIKRCLRGCGMMEPMSASELISCILNAQEALNTGK